MSERPVDLEILRYDPDKDEEPAFQTYRVPCQEDWVVLDAVNYVKDVLDRTGHKPTDEIDLTATTATVDLEAIDSLSTEELQLVLPVLRKILGRGES